MRSIVTCTILNILSYFNIHRFIKLYKLEVPEVLDVLISIKLP
jgi:hypothetical protein